MLVGIYLGSMICPGTGTTEIAACGLPRVGVAGPGSRRPKLMGMEATRVGGNAILVRMGVNSSSPTTTDCTPNEVNVVKLRRERWAQALSSKLSANIRCSNMASSQRE